LADPAPSSDKKPSKTTSGVAVNPKVAAKPETIPLPIDKQADPTSPGAQQKLRTVEAAEAADIASSQPDTPTGRQQQPVSGERFVNTKLNIALINDPKNGPRFTMTKREAGLTEGDGGKTETVGTPEAETGSAAEPADADSAKNGSKSAALRARADGDNDHGELSSHEENVLPKAEAAASHVEPAVSGHSLPHPAPTGVPPAAEPPSKVPVDSSKIFVGRNGTYYDESWRWMDWRGIYRSWNWPAALTFGHWFAYRRLYKLAGLFLMSITGLAIAAVNQVPIIAVGAAAILLAGLSGLYANILYFRVFRRAVAHVTENGEGSYRELNDQLAAAGGVDRRAPFVMAGLSLAAIAIVLGATYYRQNGFGLNLWPF
jgi:hypothetical protein